MHLAVGSPRGLGRLVARDRPGHAGLVPRLLDWFPASVVRARAHARTLDYTASGRAEPTAEALDRCKHQPPGRVSYCCERRRRAGSLDRSSSGAEHSGSSRRVTSRWNWRPGSECLFRCRCVAISARASDEGSNPRHVRGAWARSSPAVQRRSDLLARAQAIAYGLVILVPRPHDWFPASVVSARARARTLDYTASGRAEPTAEALDRCKHQPPGRVSYCCERGRRAGSLDRSSSGAERSGSSRRVTSRWNWRPSSECLVRCRCVAISARASDAGSNPRRVRGAWARRSPAVRRSDLLARAQITALHLVLVPSRTIGSLRAWCVRERMRGRSITRRPGGQRPPPRHSTGASTNLPGGSLIVASAGGAQVR